MNKELVDTIKEYIASTNDIHTQYTVLEKKANELEKTLNSRQIDKDRLSQMLDKCASAGFINSIEAATFNDAIIANTNNIITLLDKIASVQNSREDDMPLLGKALPVENRRVERNPGSKADEVFLARF